MFMRLFNGDDLKVYIIYCRVRNDNGMIPADSKKG
jgi:hypothetical protein